MKGDDLLDKLTIAALCTLLGIAILLAIPFVVIMFRMAFGDWF